MKRVRVSHTAEHDLDEIWYYVANKSGSVHVADRLLETITEAFPLLARAPKAGVRRDEIESGLRGFPVGNYIIYFAETERRVVVSRILHGMRDQRSAYKHSDEGAYS